jgi:aminoglycoside phosphotransferase (APT) family kinase protein
MTPDLPGIDVNALTEWLLAAGVADADRTSMSLVAGGRSNLTYSLDLPDGRRWILRRPPTGHTLASAHDVLREFRVLAALAPTDVPVPAVRGSDGGAVLGAPFYVMDLIEGVVPTSVEAVSAWTRAQRHQCGLELVDALAALHDVRPAEVGLSDLGRPEGYLRRQLRRWHQQWADSTDREVPEVDRAHDRLAAAMPADGPATLVHGDYHVGNCVFGPDARLAAVLDWEMCTQGDAFADLAMMLMYWGRDGSAPVVTGSPTSADGFAEQDELRARYERRRNVALPDLDWYLAFANWRLACIVEGVLSRVTHGAMGDVDRFDLDWLRETPVERARLALDLLG